MTTTPESPEAVLDNSLPADPNDHGPIGVPSDAVRAVLDELETLRSMMLRALSALGYGQIPTP
jgi:hypothetical protein